MRVSYIYMYTIFDGTIIHHFRLNAYIYTYIREAIVVFDLSCSSNTSHSRFIRGSSGIKRRLCARRLLRLRMQKMQPYDFTVRGRHYSRYYIYSRRGSQ